MKELILTRPAIDDLDEIWAFIADDNIQAADRVQREIRAAMDMLCAMPGIGHQRSDTNFHGYLFWTVYSYVIAYRIDGEKLFVSRVVHGARDFRRLFPDR